jgi:hypothetical protein
MADIDDILKDIEIEKIADPSNEAASEDTQKEDEVDTSPESIEKIASFLDAYSEKDTIIDDIARIAVLRDKVELAKAAAKEAEKND